MEKKHCLPIFFIVVLLFSVLAGAWFVGLVKANPFDRPVDTGFRIYPANFVSYQVKPYENSTVPLTIEVILVYDHYDQSWAESVHLGYSLDGQPLIEISDFTVKNCTNYGHDKQNFLRYTATVKLENLVEGSHTLTAYANDTQHEYAYINGLSALYDFTVDSHYQVTDVEQTPEPQSEPFPTTMVITPVASMAIICIGLRVYFKNRGG